MNMSLPPCDLIELYALGGLSNAERIHFEYHLETCAGCRMRLVELREVTDALLYDIPDMEPPAGMRGRVIDVVTAAYEPPVRRPAGQAADPSASLKARQVSVEKAGTVRKETSMSNSRRSWQERFFPLVCGATAVVVVLLGWQMQRMDALRGERAAEEVKQAAAIGKITEQVEMKPGQNFQRVKGTATVWVEDGNRFLTVRTQHLEFKTYGKQYAVYVLNGETSVYHRPFTPDDYGNGLAAVSVPHGTFDRILITLEPDQNLDYLPRGEVVMSADL